jgi:hypothetical protein
VTSSDHPGPIGREARCGTSRREENVVSSDSYNLSAAHLMATPDDDDVDDDDDDDDVFYLFVLAETKNRSRVIYTLRKVHTIRGCLEGLTLMI